MINAVKGKLISDKPVKFASLSGRKILAKAEVAGKPFSIEMYLAWDAKHHTMLGLFAMVPTAAAADRAPLDAFFASFQVSPGAAPPAIIVK